MKVKATKMGYYNNQRKRTDEEFDLVPIKRKINGKDVVITPEQQFSKEWMEKVEKDKPKTISPEKSTQTEPDQPKLPAGQKGTGDQDVI